MVSRRRIQLWSRFISFRLNIYKMSIVGRLYIPLWLRLISPLDGRRVYVPLLIFLIIKLRVNSVFIPGQWYVWLMGRPRSLRVLIRRALPVRNGILNVLGLKVIVVRRYRPSIPQSTLYNPLSLNGRMSRRLSLICIVICLRLPIKGRNPFDVIYNRLLIP